MRTQIAPQGCIPSTARQSSYSKRPLTPAGIQATPCLSGGRRGPCSSSSGPCSSSISCPSPRRQPTKLAPARAWGEGRRSMEEEVLSPDDQSGLDDDGGAPPPRASPVPAAAPTPVRAAVLKKDWALRSVIKGGGGAATCCVWDVRDRGVFTGASVYRCVGF